MLSLRADISLAASAVGHSRACSARFRRQIGPPAPRIGGAPGYRCHGEPIPERAMSPTRVMLDTNLWSSIGDEQVVDEFNAAMASRSVEIVTPPSILVEVARLPVAAARQRIIYALTTGRRDRLRTEAALESAELIGEARRVRPHWLRRMLDTARTASLDTFWTKKVWREAADNSTRIHEYQVAEHAVETDYLVSSQKRDRRELLRTNFEVRPLTAIRAERGPDTPEAYLCGWSGEPVEAWRIVCRDIY